jgi:hypothetical protein
MYLRRSGETGIFVSLSEDDTWCQHVRRPRSLSTIVWGRSSASSVCVAGQLQTVIYIAQPQVSNPPGTVANRHRHRVDAGF